MEIAIIGGGASACFSAIELASIIPDAKIVIYEYSSKLLSKVSITGGGRCNISNSFQGIKQLSEAYPRGDKLIKRAFSQFSPQDCHQWFEQKGIELMIEDNYCIYPKSQSALSVVERFYYLLNKYKITIKTSYKIDSIEPLEQGYSLHFADAKLKNAKADIVVVATGGYSHLSKYKIFERLNLDIISPVPSLFTLKINDNRLRQLSGISNTHTRISLAGTKFKAEGSLLITDWGFSGPACLKLSSYAARYLHEKDYKAMIHINWLGNKNEQEAQQIIKDLIDKSSEKLIFNCKMANIVKRLWSYLLNRIEIKEDCKCKSLNSKQINKLIQVLINDSYEIIGKANFKEEFVSCGGIALSNININTLECKKHKDLYFCGEILDIDAITGGFNLQAAWSTAYVVAHSIYSKAKEQSANV